MASDLIERLRTLSAMINMGEKISWGEDTALMDEAATALAVETERAEKAEALADRLKLEAQIHAGEARCANDTINQAYRAVTGGTGEPGNWHGAEPIKQALAETRAALAEAKRLLKVFADVAEQDIDEIEKDADRFVPMRTYNKAPLLTVGDLRAAARFLAHEEGRPSPKGGPDHG